jgi:heptaprenyl diphosphate synthase
MRSPGESLRPDERIRRIAVLTACACSLQIAESFFPTPLPGVKLGLANMMTLVGIVALGWRAGFVIAVSRVFLSSLVLASFLSPSFLLSLTGAVASALVMSGLHAVSGRPGFWRVSLAGISVAGALGHSLSQAGMVYLFFVRSPGLLYLLPWICLSALASGWVTGYFGIRVVERISAGASGSAPGRPVREARGGRKPFFWTGIPQVTAGLLARMSAAAKMALFLALALAASLVRDPLVLLALWSAVLGFGIVGGLGPGHFLRSARFLAPLLILSLGLPVLFERTGRIAFSLAGYDVYVNGIVSGSAYALRLLVLSSAAVLVMRTSRPVEIFEGLRSLSGRMGSRTGILDRFLRVQSLVMECLPRVWAALWSRLGPRNLRKIPWTRFGGYLGGIVADIYFSDPGSLGTAGKGRS